MTILRTILEMCTSAGRADEDTERTWLLANNADGDGAQSAKRRSQRRFFGVLFAHGTLKDRIVILFAIFAIFVQTIIPPLLMMMLGQFTNVFSKQQAASHVHVNGSDPSPAEIRNATNHEELSHETLKFSCISFFVTIVTFIAAFIQKYQWELIAIKQEHRIRRAFMAQILKLDIAWIEKNKASDISHMLHDHIERLYEGISDHIPTTIFILSAVSLSFMVAVHVQWDLALIMMGMAPAFVILRYIYSWLFAKHMQIEQESLSSANKVVSETFQCIRTVIAFSGQRNSIEKYQRFIEQSKECASKRHNMSAFMEALIWFLMDAVYLLGMCYGVAHLSINRDLGSLIGVLIIMTSVFATLMGIGGHINGTLTTIARARELQEVLDVVPTIDGDINRGEKHTNCEGAIRFENVSFAYPSRPDYQVLDNLSFSVAPGEHVALVGSSGSGKSTIAALILRLYDPDSGTIYLDNRPIRSLNVDWMRHRFGYVSQEPVLFDETISVNVRCGKLLATDAEVEAALDKANALEYIRTLPQGWETRVGERGAQLSGGQKQRVAIARAMIRQPNVLIFDEATSALDSEHEAMVQDAIEKVSVGISSLTIAHRLTTVQKCDRVIVLERGRIVEMGSPSELMTAQGIFYRMAKEQAITEAPPGLAGDLSQLGTATSGTEWEGLPPTVRHRRRSTSYSAKINPHPQSDYMPSDAESVDITMRRGLRVDRDAFFPAISALDISETIPEGAETATAPLVVKQRSSFLTIIKMYRDGYWKLLVGVLGCTFKALCFLMWPIMLVAVIESISGTSKNFGFLIMIWFIVVLIRFMAEYVATYLLSEFGSGLVTRLKGSLFHQLLRNQVAYFDEQRNSAANLSSRLSTDTGNVRKLLSERTEQMMTDFLTAVLGSVVATYISPLFSLACCYQLPIMIGARVIEVRANIRRQAKVMPVEENAHKLASIALSHMATIKAYSLQHRFFQMYNAALLPVEHARRQQSRISAIVYAIQNSLVFFIYMCTFIVGSFFIEYGYLQPFDFLRILFLSQIASTRLAIVVTSVNDIVRSFVSSTTLVNVLQEEVPVDNLSDAGLTPGEFDGNIRLSKVRFYYPTRPESAILNELSLNIKAGKTIALVGPSGSGKSTIIQLVQRLYDPVSGRITVNGYDLRDYNLSYLRRKIVPVSQEPTLFDATIWENIAYGLDPLEVTQERIVGAAKLANIHDFIISLPKGYNEPCGEFGAQLSGGQKQRIAIARALIRKPSILLLDEATAALDSASERSVQLALENAAKGATCLVIAHRLSTIQNADEIFVIVAGQIVERGNHNQLLQREGLYYNMCHRQITE